MTISWGLIGVGDIANKRVAAAIQADPRSELVAVCRRSPAPLAAFADQFGVPLRFTDANELITSPDVDAVYIATPVACHCPQVLQAAEAGKHVLVEKPMALTPAECEQMIMAAEKANVQLGVAYYRRFYPVVQRIEQIIRAGELGRVLSVGCVTGNPTQFPVDNWRVQLSEGGGGPLMDIGSHRIDLFHQLMGEVKSVQASFIASPDYAAEQVASLMCTFQCGAHGLLQCYFGTADVPDRLEIIGTRGRLTVEDLNAGEMVFAGPHGIANESHPPAANLHGPLITDFTGALAEGRRLTLCGKVGKQTNEVIAQAYAQMYSESN